MENEKTKLLYEVSHRNMVGEKSRSDLVVHNNFEEYIQLSEKPRSVRVPKEAQVVKGRDRYIYNETEIKTQTVLVVMTWSRLVT